MRADESRTAQAPCGVWGRLRGCGKSKRSKVPPNGDRCDSTGMPDAFPSQRISAAGRVVRRLPRPAGLWSVKIFSHPRRRPQTPHGACAVLLSGLRQKTRVNVARGVREVLLDTKQVNAEIGLSACGGVEARVNVARGVREVLLDLKQVNAVNAEIGHPPAEE